LNQTPAAGATRKRRTFAAFRHSGARHPAFMGAYIIYRVARIRQKPKQGAPA